MTTRSISNSDDVIDSRDVIDRIDELRGELDTLVEAAQEAQGNLEDAEDDEARQAAKVQFDEAMDALVLWLECDNDDHPVEIAKAIKPPVGSLKDYGYSDDARELFALEALADDAAGYAPDWIHGATLIRESYWVEYVQEMLVDIGDLPKELPHYIEIDWEKTADNIRADYTDADFDGVTYLIR